VLSEFNNDAVLTRISDLVPDLLLSFAVAKRSCRQAIVTELEQLAQKEQTGVAKIVFGHEKLLESAIRSLDEAMENPFLTFMRLIISENAISMANLCLKNIDRTGLAKNYFLDYFTLVVSEVQEPEYLQTVLTKCLELIPSAQGEVFVGLSKVLTEVVKA
jgi:hypothetical protein